MNKRSLVLILILGLSFLPLIAAIEAAYVPAQSLAFTTGSTPFAPSDFVAHLGTLTITATAGETLYQPSLVNAQISSTFQFNGPVTWSNHWQTGLPVYQTQNTVFYFAVVTTELGVTGYRKLWSGGGTAPMTATKDALGVSVFEAKFYFLSDQNSSIYKPGAIYTMTNGNIGSFNVAVAANDQGINYNYIPKIYVPINGQTIPPGGGPPIESPTVIPPGTPALPYGDTPEQAVFGFSIIDEASFSLPSGYLSNSVLIAKAQLTLSNTTVGTTYGVDIQFSKLPGSTSFALHPYDLPTGYPIPYQLNFLGQTVQRDVSIPWTPLSEGINIQNIHVTGISPIIAEAARSGSYIDTIVVTITPIE